MTAYEWSRKHNAYTKICWTCHREFIGDPSEELTRKILAVNFYAAPKRSGGNDGFGDRCRDCCINEAHGRFDYPNTAAILESQNWECSICHTEVALRSMYERATAAMDHNKRTGKSRGVLCNKCNVALSYLEDKEWHRKALMYLAKWNAKHENN